MGSAQLNLVNLVSICVSLEEFLLNHVETIKIVVFVGIGFHQNVTKNPSLRNKQLLLLVTLVTD